jgi:hypothetical protein
MVWAVILFAAQGSGVVREPVAGPVTRSAAFTFGATSHSASATKTLYLRFRAGADI